jgi:hypothetical protein
VGWAMVQIAVMLLVVPVAILRWHQRTATSAPR